MWMNGRERRQQNSYNWKIQAFDVALEMFFPHSILKFKVFCDERSHLLVDIKSKWNLAESKNSFCRS